MKTLCLTLLLALTATLSASLAQAEIRKADGAKLRVLDKMVGAVADLDLAVGQAKSMGKLTVQLDECRYPSDLPTGEAYAHLTIIDSDMVDPAFVGWMIESSPALSALDHPRYDVWVLRCDVPQADQPAEATTSDGKGSGG